MTDVTLFQTKRYGTVRHVEATSARCDDSYIRLDASKKLNAFQFLIRLETRVAGMFYARLESHETLSKLVGEPVRRRVT